MTSKERTGYVYKMFDDESGALPPVYIGRTAALKNRFRCHFYNKDNGKMGEEEYKSICRIEYADCGSYDNAVIAERYLITNIKPKYNTDFVDGVATFGENEVNSLIWKSITGSKLDKLKSSMRPRKRGLRKANILKNCILFLNTGHSYQLYYPRKEPVHVLYKVMPSFLEEKHPENWVYPPTEYYSGKIYYEKDNENIYREAAQMGIPYYRSIYLNVKINSCWKENDFIDLKLLMNHPECDRDFLYPDSRKEVRKMVQVFITQGS